MVEDNRSNEKTVRVSGITVGSIEKVGHGPAGVDLYYGFESPVPKGLGVVYRLGNPGPGFNLEPWAIQFQSLDENGGVNGYPKMPYPEIDPEVEKVRHAVYRALVEFSDKVK